MKDTHLTLRLPRELARALARWARERGVSKSQVAREAVVRYLAPASPERTLPVTAAEVAARWPTLPHLTPAEAAAFAADLETARRELPPDRDPWA